jgi:acyl-CoA thioester hydrolase
MSERAAGRASGVEVLSDIAAPFDAYRDIVRAEWIDYNQHMNVGCYLASSDFATDEVFRWVGLEDTHRQAHGVTTFCLEAHVTYHREAREGDPLGARGGG